MSSRLVRRLACREILAAEGPEALLQREWIVTNGLGGYASGTVAEVSTRRYHGLLVAALDAPQGRMMMLNHLAESLLPGDGTVVRLGGRERLGQLTWHAAATLTEFRLESGLPVWRYEAGDIVVEKHVLMSHRQNSTYVLYRLVEGEGPIRLRLRPSLNIRHHDASVSEPLRLPYALTMQGDHYEITDSRAAGTPSLRLHVAGRGAKLTLAGGQIRNLHYRKEAARGYPDTGDLWSPGYFQVEIERDSPAALIASTEDWTTMLAQTAEEALAAERLRRARLIRAADPRLRSGAATELVLAADQFLIIPAGREADTARSHATGDEVRTVIAGYHWFTDWGRDTMISLEGLTLSTGRAAEAGYILRTFARYIRDGLIPNMFPEGRLDGLYHTADATLWFFHAIDRYLAASGDDEILTLLLPDLLDIIEHHRRGTRFGIGMDPDDALLRQGAEGYQLTWMDAKVDGWVVTPRRGKAVEINALWYNALRLMARWVGEHREEADALTLAELADEVRDSFNARFWYAEGGHLYDVVDGESGDDPACRPNQVLAISLPNPVLAEGRWASVMEVVHRELLTPVGLRSLSPTHPDFKPTYHGDLRTRDAAYHQGTVWPWLIGPYVDAYLKVHPDDRAGARAALQGVIDQMNLDGVGTISEICDATEPYAPRGCIAQAWSVAEVLRCWAKSADEASQSG